MSIVFQFSMLWGMPSKHKGRSYTGNGKVAMRFGGVDSRFHGDVDSEIFFVDIIVHPIH